MGTPASDRTPNGSVRAAKGHVLLVDDDRAILLMYSGILGRAGYTVVTASGGHEASALIAQRKFDAVVSDIAMPELDGLTLLRRVRARDEDVPVLLMTGAPALDTAIEALERGAQRYLLKPVEPRAMVQAVDRAVTMCRLAAVQKRAVELLGPQIEAAVISADLDNAFERALGSMRLEFQPIVRWSNRSVIAYEALLRNGDQRLGRPPEFLRAAEELGRLQELGRAIRKEFSVLASAAPAGVDLYLNLHPQDLEDDDLYSPRAPLSAHARHVVLEITERAPLGDVKDVRGRVEALRALGFRIALDDMGAGYAGLATFASLEPDVVKIDLGLVRGADRDPTKGALLTSLIGLCNVLGMEVIAEGIESPGEREVLAGIGCDLMQGYLFARPGKPFPDARF